jgi:tRNA dimethylallyltransferase
MAETIKPPLVAIVGPTAVGKTEIAITLAEQLNGEIVSADSRLLYRGMDIGTAKPSAEQRARVPHHLIDVAEPDDTWSLSQFQHAAREVIADIHARGKLPLLVGGTGQYVRAIVEGWTPPKLGPQPHLRAALEAWAAEVGGDGLHQRLAIVDPKAATFIDARNVRRTQRALEVIFATGRRFSAQRGKGEATYRLLIVGLTLPREELYRRIESRIDAMLATGWLAEVEGLLDKGYSAKLPAMSAIGYAQLSRHLAGELSLSEAKDEIVAATKAFVRRQNAWFRPSDKGIKWFDVRSGIEREIETEIRAFLKA